jgi:ubiquinone/menaquinone biosynthesis C-methylase UbiE
MHWRVRQFIEVMRGYKRRSRMLLWNWRSRSFPKGVDGFFQLHIGCGEIDSAEFVNIDARAHPHVHLVTRHLFDLQSVPDAVASLVYMCHVLEHVPQAMVHKVLLEMRRVLKPGER